MLQDGFVFPGSGRYSKLLLTLEVSTWIIWKLLWETCDSAAVMQASISLFGLITPPIVHGRGSSFTGSH